MTYLLILNDPPYGTERSYNALRLALSLRKHERAALKLFLLGGAVSCARTGQKTQRASTISNACSEGSRHGVFLWEPVAVVWTRRLTDADLVEGVHRSSMEELTGWTMEAEQVLVF